MEVLFVFCIDTCQASLINKLQSMWPQLETTRVYMQVKLGDDDDAFHDSTKLALGAHLTCTKK